MSLHIMGGVECIRAFPDQKGVKGAYPFIEHTEFGSKDYQAMVEDAQARGMGVFFSVNATDGVGAKAENIIRVRSFYVDIDGVEDRKTEALSKLITAKLKPSAIVETKSGVHAYWYTSQQTPVNHVLYRRVQNGLIRAFGGDRQAKDIARVLRVPDTWHMKREPFLVRIVHQLPESQTPYYAADDLLSEYPAPKERPLREVRIVKSPKRWENYLEDLSEWEPIPGDRNRIMLLSAGLAIKFGVDKEDYIDTMYPIVITWDTGRDELQELRRVANWAYDKGRPVPPGVLYNNGVPIRRNL